MPPRGSADVVQSAHTGPSICLTGLIDNRPILHLKVPVGGRRRWTRRLNTWQWEVGLSCHFEVIWSDLCSLTWWNTFAVLFRVCAVQVIDGVYRIELNLCQVSFADTNKRWRRRSGIHDHSRHWDKERECRADLRFRKKRILYSHISLCHVIPNCLISSKNDSLVSFPPCSYCEWGLELSSINIGHRRTTKVGHKTYELYFKSCKIICIFVFIL